MHRVRRDSVDLPTCLLGSPRLYSELHGSEKSEIRSALLNMQGHRCAYCERRTGDDRDDGHIEHFRNQAQHTDLQCDWTNMFWSCNDEKTCGKHKDKCTRQSGPLKCFDPADIVNPANEDPENFLLFVSDGTIRPVEGLSDLDLHRVNETLRIFQLNASPLLRKSREDAVKPYIRTIELLSEMDSSAVVKYIEKEREEVDKAPFSAAIKAFFRSVIS